MGKKNYTYTNNEEDKELVKKYLSGDTKAFKPLFYKYKAIFFYNAKKWYSYSGEELQDMAMEFLGRISAKLHLYDETKALVSTWMTNSMKNFMIEYHNRSKNKPINGIQFEDIPEIKEEETIYKQIENKRYRRLMRKMIESLGIEDTRMFNEILLKGKTQTEVAREMGLKISTLNYRFARLKRRLEKFRPQYY